MEASGTLTSALMVKKKLGNWKRDKTLNIRD